MLNSCIRRLLNRICGEKSLFVRHFDLIPTKEKQGREMAEAVSMFWINLKIIWSMSTLMWLKGRLLQYYSVSQVSSLYLFAGYFLKISSTFRLDFNLNASFIIHLILFFIYKKAAEADIRRLHVNNKHMYCNGKYISFSDFYLLLR